MVVNRYQLGLTVVVNTIFSIMSIENRLIIGLASTSTDTSEVSFDSCRLEAAVLFRENFEPQPVEDLMSVCRRIYRVCSVCLKYLYRDSIYRGESEIFCPKWAAGFRDLYHHHHPNL